jgi:hypothetical protein
MARKPKKPREMKIVVFARDSKSEIERAAYLLLDALVEDHRKDLAEGKARIALAWQRGVKRDADQHLKLGRCIKSSPVHRQLHQHDFVICLNQEAWAGFNANQRAALLDHELYHAARAFDKNGSPKCDADGKPTWRCRKHDVEEFAAVVGRHGLWKEDLVEFHKLSERKKKAPLMAASPDATGAAPPAVN